MLKAAQAAITEFHRAVGQPIGASLDTDVGLRLLLIEEESQEFDDALHVSDEEVRLVRVADALGDLIYVVIGAAVTWGIDLSPVFEEIHRSNLTKIIGGVLKRSDGKVMKGPGYEPPDIRKALGLKP